LKSAIAGYPEYWQPLTSRPERAENRVLTVYLNVDQSEQANLNRGFERAVKDMLNSVRWSISTDRELSYFDAASRAMQELAETYNVAARGLIAIFDTADGFFWSQEVEFSTINSIHWGRLPYLLPLAIALEKSERVNVVLIDKANLRLASIVLGEFQEHLHRSFDRKKVRHTKTVGMNTLSSAGRAQQKADEQVHSNIRLMIRDIDRTFAEHGAAPIILAGSSKITSELEERLPKRLAARVIGHVDIGMDSTASRIADVSQALLKSYNNRSEETVVNELITSAAKAGRAVIGLEDTLRAINHHRIWQLVYGDGFQAPGYECGRCSALFSAPDDRCPFCGSHIQRIDDIVSRVAEQAIRKDARIEVVRSKKAQSALIKAGAIGAFLRARTGALRAS
jgi:hypothetical protein